MLTEQIVIDSINVVPTNHVEVRTAIVVFRDDVEIARTFHRHVLAPGDDLSEQDERVRSVAEAVWALIEPESVENDG